LVTKCDEDAQWNVLISLAWILAQPTTLYV